MHTLFGFSGRINRAKWWLAVLVILIVSVVGAVIQQVTSNATSGIGAIVALVLSIVQIWISLAAGAKRLHDLNRTGAWLVLFVGAPFVLLGIFIAYAAATLDFNAILAGQTPSEPELMKIGGVTAILGLIWLALAIWSLIWFGCLRGTVGPNQYGQDPLEGKL